MRGVLSGLDPATVAFRAASGATDTAVIDQIAKYLKSQSLWDHCRLFPFKSAQNAGAGSTVYGIGGWTSNNIQTFGGPNWGSSGLAFDAVDDRGTVTLTGARLLSELYTFDVQAPVQASLPDNGRRGAMSMSNNNSTNWLGWQAATGLISGETMDLGITGPSSLQARRGADFSWSAGQRHQVVWRHSLDGKIWFGKTEETSYITYGTQDFRPSSSGVTNDVINISSDLYTGTPSSFIATTRVALLFCKTSLTQIQREKITDYLDAL